MSFNDRVEREVNRRNKKNRVILLLFFFFNYLYFIFFVDQVIKTRLVIFGEKILFYQGKKLLIVTTKLHCNMLVFICFD